jgi:hypothetical protein
MIFLCFIQNLTIAGSKEDFKSFFGVSFFFQGFKYESISTPKITDKVGASGVLYLA